MTKKWALLFVVTLLLALALLPFARREPFTATFSIVALDPATGDLGVAVASKFPSVGAMVPYARADVGAVATQAAANLSFGPEGLQMMALGFSAREALDQLVENDDGRDNRQVGLVDAHGRAAAWTGKECFPYAGHIAGKNFTVQGNILTGRNVIEAMAETFQRTSGSLPERLMAALEAGDRAGGDRRGKESAALLVVRKNAGYGGVGDRWVDLRVDDHSEPVAELRRLLDVHTLYFGESTQLVPLTPELVREIQEALAQAGFYRGEANGVYDSATRKALEDYQGWENLEMRFRTDEQIDAVVLDYLRKHHEPRRQ
ncbi:MAG: DUF1028 domain-containing protein [Terriglobia bacterium]